MRPTPLPSSRSTHKGAVAPTVPPSRFGRKAQEAVPTPSETLSNAPPATEGPSPASTPTIAPDASQAIPRHVADSTPPLPQAPAAPVGAETHKPEPPSLEHQGPTSTLPTASLPALPKLQYPSSAPVLIQPEKRYYETTARSSQEVLHDLGLFAERFWGETGRGTRPEMTMPSGPLQEVLASAIAAPLGSEVRVTAAGAVRYAPEGTVGVTLKGVDTQRTQFYSLWRDIIVKPDGTKYISNELISLRNKGSGLGTSIFSQQVANSTALGFSYIKTHAVSAESMNGAYTWPALGYNITLDQLMYANPHRKHDGIITRLFPEAEDLLDVLATPQVKGMDRDSFQRYAQALNDAEQAAGRPGKERTSLTGREWWKAHCWLGTSLPGGNYGHELTFDLTERSKSHQALQAYLDSLGKRSRGKAMSAPKRDDDNADGLEEIYLTDEQDEALDRAWVGLSQKWAVGKHGQKDFGTPTEFTPALYTTLDRHDDEPQELIDVADIRQRDDYSCLCCASMSAAFYWGVGPGHELWQKYRHRWQDKKVQDQLTTFIEEWKKILGTNRVTSTHPHAIVSYLESLGLEIEARDNLTLDDLAAYWKRGWPVICMIQEYGDATKEKHPSVADEEVPGADRRPAAFNYGHGVVFIGGPALGCVFVQDPSIDNLLQDENADAAKGRMMIPVLDWLKNWHDRDVHGNQFIRYGIAVGPTPGGAKQLGHEGNIFGFETPKPPPPPQESLESYMFDEPSVGVKDLDQPHKFSSTQFDLGEAGYTRTQGSPLPRIAELRQAIAGDDLAADGKEDRAHITVLYGLHTKDPQDVAKVVQEWCRQEGKHGLTAYLGDVSLFPAQEASSQRGGADFDVVKLDVDSPDLESLHRYLAEHLEHTDTHPDYHPHVTLAYVKPGRGQRYAGPGLDGHQVILTRLLFSDPDHQETVLDLSSDAGAVANKDWECAHPDCEWSVLQSGGESDQDRHPQPPIHSQEQWERAHADRREQDVKAIKPGLGQGDFTFYQQAYNRWRVKPDVLGERRVRLGWQRGTPADQLAIQNDEEFRLTHESRQPLVEMAKDEKAWGQTCLDGSRMSPNTNTCQGREGGWDGLGTNDQAMTPDESWYPDYAPTSGVNNRPDDEKEPPVVGPAAVSLNPYGKKDVPTCPDGSPMPVSTRTCAGREGWIPWTEEQRQQNELYLEETPSPYQQEEGPIRAKYPNAPTVPPSRYGRKYLTHTKAQDDAPPLPTMPQVPNVPPANRGAAPGRPTPPPAQAPTAPAQPTQGSPAYQVMLDRIEQAMGGTQPYGFAGTTHDAPAQAARADVRNCIDKLRGKAFVRPSPFGKRLRGYRHKDSEEMEINAPQDDMTPLEQKPTTPIPPKAVPSQMVSTPQAHDEKPIYDAVPVEETTTVADAPTRPEQPHQLNPIKQTEKLIQEGLVHFRERLKYRPELIGNFGYGPSFVNTVSDNAYDQAMRSGATKEQANQVWLAVRTEATRAWAEHSGDEEIYEELEEHKEDTTRQTAERNARRDYEEHGTRSRTFKNWFGDWENDPNNSSKVVNPNSGEPLIVYHGAPQGGFLRFDPKRIGSNTDTGTFGTGFYFTSDRQIARNYAHYAGDLQRIMPSVYEVYLDIKTPFQWDGDGILGLIQEGTPLPNEIHDEVIQRSGFNQNVDFAALPEKERLRIAQRICESVRAVLEEKGYDGIVSSRTDWEGRSNTEFVAFRPNQIKAKDNRGTFDPTKHNIYKDLEDVPVRRGMQKHLRVRPSPFGRKALEINSTKARLQRALRVDLITLPEGAQGTCCKNCIYLADEPKDYCRHPDLMLHLWDGAARMTCKRWWSDGAIHPDGNTQSRLSLPVLSGDELERARLADLITLPQGISYTNCGDCEFQTKGYCHNPKVDQPVTPRKCCDEWDADGSKRAWRDGSKAFDRPLHMKPREVLHPDQDNYQSIEGSDLYMWDNVKELYHVKDEEVTTPPNKPTAPGEVSSAPSTPEPLMVPTTPSTTTPAATAPTHVTSPVEEPLTESPETETAEPLKVALPVEEGDGSDVLDALPYEEVLNPTEIEEYQYHDALHALEMASPAFGEKLGAWATDVPQVHDWIQAIGADPNTLDHLDSGNATTVYELVYQSYDNPALLERLPHLTSIKALLKEERHQTIDRLPIVGAARNDRAVDTMLKHIGEGTNAPITQAFPMDKRAYPPQPGQLLFLSGDVKSKKYNFAGVVRKVEAKDGKWLVTTHDWEELPQDRIESSGLLTGYGKGYANGAARVYSEFSLGTRMPRGTTHDPLPPKDYIADNEKSSFWAGYFDAVNCRLWGTAAPPLATQKSIDAAHKKLDTEKEYVSPSSMKYTLPDKTDALGGVAFYTAFISKVEDHLVGIDEGSRDENWTYKSLFPDSITRDLAQYIISNAVAARWLSLLQKEPYAERERLVEIIHQVADEVRAEVNNGHADDPWEWPMRKRGEKALSWLGTGNGGDLVAPPQWPGPRPREHSRRIDKALGILYGAKALPPVQQGHQPTLAVDLDGTLADTPPHTGRPPDLHIMQPRDGAAEAMRHFHDMGWQIIIWTVRDDYDEIKAWLKQHGIPWDHINENPDQPTTSPKIISDLYIDDRAIRPDDWDDVVAEVDNHTQARQPITPDAGYASLQKIAERAQPELEDMLSILELPTHQHDGIPGSLEPVLSQPGGVIVLAPIKGEARATEKVDSDYGGDWSRLLDVVRASVAMDSLPALKRAMTTLEEGGAKLARPVKNRFDAPLANGYRDILANYRLPSGAICEVQFHLKPILAARERERLAYDVVRAIKAALKDEGRDSLTSGEIAAVQRARDDAQRMFAHAWQQAQKSLRVRPSPFTYRTKANYTGVFYDSLGRKTCYAAGKKVPCTKDETPRQIQPRQPQPAPELALPKGEDRTISRAHGVAKIEGHRPKKISTYALVFNKKGQLLVRPDDEQLGGFVWTIEVLASAADDAAVVQKAIEQVAGLSARRFSTLGHPETGQGYYLAIALDDDGGDDTTWQDVDEIGERVAQSSNPQWHERGQQILDAAYAKWSKKGKVVPPRVKRSPFKKASGEVAQKDEPVEQTGGEIPKAEPAAVLEPAVGAAPTTPAEAFTETQPTPALATPAGGGGEGGESAQPQHPSPTGTQDTAILHNATTHARTALERFKEEASRITDAPVLKQVKYAYSHMQDAARKVFSKLEARYGRKTALAVFAFGQTFSWGAFLTGGALGKPVVIPSTLAMLPAVVAAELLHQWRKQRDKKDLDLPVGDIQKLADEAMRELAQEYINYST